MNSAGRIESALRDKAHACVCVYVYEDGDSWPEAKMEKMYVPDNAWVRMEDVLSILCDTALPIDKGTCNDN